MSETLEVLELARSEMQRVELVEAARQVGLFGHAQALERCRIQDRLLFFHVCTLKVDECPNRSDGVPPVFFRPGQLLFSGLLQNAHQIALLVVIASDFLDGARVPSEPVAHELRQQDVLFLDVMRELRKLGEEPAEGPEVVDARFARCFEAERIRPEGVEGYRNDAVLPIERSEGAMRLGVHHDRGRIKSRARVPTPGNGAGRRWLGDCTSVSKQLGAGSMSDEKLDPTTGVPLEIRSRQTVEREGAVRIELTVQCPLRSNAVSLEECIRCEHCVALRIETEGESTRLVCRAPSQSDAASSDFQESGSAYDYTPLLDVMTKDVVCLSPEIDVATVARLLLERNIGGAPVVDADGRPVGVVSKTDVLRACCDAFSAGRSAAEAGREFAGLRVADIMTPMAFSLPQGESVARAAAVMAFERVHRIPVVASDGKVVGLVSAIDVLRWLAKDHGFVLGG